MNLYYELMLKEKQTFCLKQSDACFALI